MTGPTAGGGTASPSTGRGLTIRRGPSRSRRGWIAAPWVDVSADGVTWERLTAEASLADAVVALGLDPRHGRGEVRFTARAARWVRLDPRVPARPPLVWVD